MVHGVDPELLYDPLPLYRARSMIVDEGLAIDQVEQGHWFAAQGMDDVPVVDHMAVLTIGIWPAPAQRHKPCRAETHWSQ